MLREKLEQALGGCDIVREVRGHGYLLGIDYVDPRDGNSFLPVDLGVARRIDNEAFARDLIVYSTQPTSDGYTGDQTLLAPAFVSSDQELDTIVERITDTVHEVENQAKRELGRVNSA